MADPIEFVIKSGKLKVDPADFRRLEMGWHVAAATAARIERLIAGLDDKEFKKRETAQTELIALGADAYPVLKERLRGAGLELTGRLKDALKQIEAQTPAERLALPADDRLVTPDGVVTGKISGEELKLRTSFGDVTVKLSLIRSIQAVRETVLTASAEKCARTPDSWVETDLQIDADTGVRLTASGKVTFDNGGAESAPIEPDGNRSHAGVEAVGLLMGRIGPDGPIFPIGKQTGVHTGLQAGKLYLHINPAGGGQRMSGEYQVRAVTGADGLADQRLPDPSVLMFQSLHREIAQLRESIPFRDPLNHMIKKPPYQDGPKPNPPPMIGIN